MMPANLTASVGAFVLGRLTAAQLQKVIQSSIAQSADGGAEIRVELLRAIDELPVSQREPLFAALGDTLSVTPAIASQETSSRPSLAIAEVYPPGETLLRSPPQTTPSAGPPARRLEPELGPGSVIVGRYRLIRELGRGGMGVVFLAESTADGQSLAVKVLGKDFREHPEAVQVLREEARKSLALRHPNIVAVYPLERDGNSYCLPMEYLAGKTLRELLDEDFARGMPVEQAAPIIKGVGAALSFAHDHGVIHSDLKPSNIFVTTGGSPRVLDFGIARAVRADSRRFDTSTLGALTEAYATCEMLEGMAPDFRDDIYGFACIIYEMLTGTHPFGGQSAATARDRGLSVAPVRVLNETQNQVLRGGLAFQRERRSATIEDLLKIFSKEPTRQFRPMFAGFALIGIAAIGIGLWWLLRAAPSSEERHTAAQAASPTIAGTQDESLHAPSSNFSDCGACPTMTVLPAGTFRMSSSREEPGRASNEFPQRLVRFEHPFAMSKTPITRGQFRAFLEQTGRAAAGQCVDVRKPAKLGLGYQSPGFPQTDDHPAVCISADDAVAYADWLNRLVGKPVYRLPSEAEWEYAARAGTRSAYAWGDTEEDACRYGNFGDLDYEKAQHAPPRSMCTDGYAYTSPVGSFPGNNWNLLDMVGNVRVWTRGCSPPANAHAIDDAEAWVQCDQQFMSARGAGFATPLTNAYTRIAVRLELPRDSVMTSNEMGFRIVRSL